MVCFRTCLLKPFLAKIIRLGHGYKRPYSWKMILTMDRVLGACLLKFPIPSVELENGFDNGPSPRFCLRCEVNRPYRWKTVLTVKVDFTRMKG